MRQSHRDAQIHFQPRIRKGAFFEAAWRHGCRTFSVYNRTYITSYFDDPVAEYWQVINHVALWPVMGERQVEISGPDAARFVQYLTPRDLSKFAVGQCKYALITAPDGGILGDPIILRRGADRFWVSTADCDLELWARGVQTGTDFDVTIADANVSVMQVQGPKSPLLLAAAFGGGIADLKYFWTMTTEFQGAEIVISRTGYSGEFGYEVYLADASKGDALFEHLLAAGKPFNVAPGCVSHARRIESAILSWGVDMTADENPFEVGLGRLVDLSGAAPYIGQRALRRIAATPPRRRLVGLTVDGSAIAPNEDVWPVMAGSREVGRLTSLAYSPRLERNIALAMVPVECAAPGQRLSVDTWDGERGAMVAETPFLAKRQQAAPASA